MVAPIDLRSIEARVKLLLNARLKDVLRDQGLPVSGVKTELQVRLLAHLNKLAALGSTGQIERVRFLVNGPGVDASSSSMYSNTPSPASSGRAPSLPQQHPTPPSFGMPPRSIRFKESPFFSVVQSLTPTMECKVREATRDHVDVSVSLSADILTRMQDNEQYRVMVFCAPENGFNAFTATDVAFPQQVELKVNLDEVKANMKGLKNRPGTTRPADITPFIRRKPSGYNNRVSLTYALTQQRAEQGSANQKFFWVVNLVKKTPVQTLVQKLRIGKTITKAQVQREMRNNAKDPDIVATSTIMSLKCPLSTLRIEVPCRSLNCKHNQCFDASSYLQLQEQAPTWICPVCTKPATFETLLMDEYVADILQSTSQNVEQVTIEPEGQWTKNSLLDTPAPSHEESGSEAEEEDDDFVEVQQHRVLTKQEVKPVRVAPTSAFNPPTQTPPLSSREESVMSSARRPNKRPASAVIDLTLSDDDDDEAQARSKRLRSSVSGGGGASLSPWGGQVQFQLPGTSQSATPTAAYDPNNYNLM